MPRLVLQFNEGSSEESATSRASLVYFVHYDEPGDPASPTLLQAQTYFESNVPATYDGMGLRVARIDNRIAETSFSATAEYANVGLVGAKETGDLEYSFEISTETARKTHSADGEYTSYGTSPPDFKGGIVKSDDTFEGADILVPVYSFAYTYYPANAIIGGPYKAAVYGLTGRVNNAEFDGFAADEVLFIGAAGARRTDDDWEINYRFLASPNLTGLQIGDIAGIAKKGWQFLWVFNELNESNGFITPKPKAVYVHTLYQQGDFTVLGLPGLT